MKKNTVKILIIAIAIFGFYISTFSNVSAENEPTMEIKPASPTPKSTITFTATLSDENTTDVRIVLQECDAKTGICFTKENISMNSIDTDTYETMFTLEHAEATYIQYSLVVNSNDGWKTYLDKTKFNLSEKQNGENGKNDTNNDNDTPGFEFIGVFISVIFIFIILNKRKR
jgi:hypothetical protein